MRAVVWHRHSAKQEDRAAARTLPANQHAQPRDPSRCFGVPGRAGGAGHAPVPGSACDCVAIADRRTSCSRGKGIEARGSRAFAFGLNRRHAARLRAPGTRCLFSILPAPLSESAFIEVSAQPIALNQYQARCVATHRTVPGLQLSNRAACWFSLYDPSCGLHVPIPAFCVLPIRRLMVPPDVEALLLT